MTKKEITFEDLYSSVTRPRYYGQKYLDADSEDKLLLVLGEACCVSAFSFVQILKLPKRGRLILKLIKTLSPQRYKKYQFCKFFSFSHCLIYTSRKLKEALKRDLSEEDSERISSAAYAYGGSYLRVISKYSEEDKKQLLSEMEQRLSDYDKCETIEENVLLENILNGLGRKIHPKQVAVFFRETIAKDPLSLVEAFRFIDRLKEIRS